MSERIRLIVDGKPAEVEVTDPAMPLLYVLRSDLDRRHGMITRRDLLKGGGALVVSFIGAPATELAFGQTSGAARSVASPHSRPTSSIRGSR